jgi:hypothetical protein
MDTTMIEETHLLCDRIQKLIDDAVALIKSDSMAEKQKQLQQIAATVENLKDAGVSVPQELIALSETLSRDVSEQDVAVEAIRALRERLEGFTDTIEPVLRTGVGRLRRAPKATLPEITPEEDFYPVITNVLRKMGGTGTARKVLEAVFQAMKNLLLPGDLEMHPSGRCENWRHTAKYARYSLIERGVLRGDAPRQTWALSEPDDEPAGG